MSNLLAQNPNFAQAKAEYAKIQKTNQLNNNVSTLVNGVNGKTTETPNYLQEVSDKLTTSL